MRTIEALFAVPTSFFNSYWISFNPIVIIEIVTNLGIAARHPCSLFLFCILIKRRDASITLRVLIRLASALNDIGKREKNKPRLAVFKPILITRVVLCFTTVLQPWPSISKTLLQVFVNVPSRSTSHLKTIQSVISAQWQRHLVFAVWKVVRYKAGKK